MGQLVVDGGGCSSLGRAKPPHTHTHTPFPLPPPLLLLTFLACPLTLPVFGTLRLARSPVPLSRPVSLPRDLRWRDSTTDCSFESFTMAFAKMSRLVASPARLDERQRRMETAWADYDSNWRQELADRAAELRPHAVHEGDL